MKNDIPGLKKKANWVRRQVLQSVINTGKGHLGGTFSCTDLLTVLYYHGLLRIDSIRPRAKDRDRLVVGKGHTCLALYHIWVDLDILSADRLAEYGTNGGTLGGQLNLDTPGVEFNTGSLGHALGIGAGMALASRMDSLDYRVFALLGDGECAEGSIWESVMFAAQHRLNNLVAIVDRNRLGVTAVVEKDDGSGTLEAKFHACGWACRVIDGHDFEQILDAFSHLDDLDRPLVVVADTIKGKGISFMEGGIKWHHSVPSPEEFEQAKRELEEGI